MDTYGSQRRRSNRARERQEARRRRQGGMAVRATPSRHEDPASVPRVQLPVEPGSLGMVRERTVDTLRDVWWRIRHHNPMILWAAAGVVVLLGVLYFLSFVLTGRIFPGVNVMGVNVGGMSISAAETALLDAWREEISIKVMVENEVVREVDPQALGLRLDALETARAARSVGFRALPFGREVDPVVTVNELSAQNYLLEITESVDVMPYNAGYAWENDRVVGVPGRDGRMLDIPLTIEQLSREANRIASRRRLDLLMVPLSPDVRDPSPYLEEAREFLEQSPVIKGYDPFTNQTLTWPIPVETFTTWLEAGSNSLTLREDAFIPYIDALNDTLNTDEESDRYLARDDTLQVMRRAISQGDPTPEARVRYRPQQYVVQRGDTGHRISRRTGIPFYEIQQTNPGLNWNMLSVGQTVNLPSRDVTLPREPLTAKRIVVDLDRQLLVAFEDGQVVFEWLISSGVNEAPTYPGVFQILNRDPVAYGSSNTLCDSAGLVCGQWEMNWFMGIYEVIPGLVNGFHGAVLLPNGNYLGGGSVGYPYTFGCIMSEDNNARMLYDWADVGTIVEIISSEFQPQSELARRVASDI